jgi:hypothetical protein
MIFFFFLVKNIFLETMTVLGKYILLELEPDPDPDLAVKIPGPDPTGSWIPNNEAKPIQVMPTFVSLLPTFIGCGPLLTYRRSHPVDPPAPCSLPPHWGGGKASGWANTPLTIPSVSPASIADFISL